MSKFIVTTILGLIVAAIGKYAFDLNFSLFSFSPNIYINAPTTAKPDPAQDAARRAAESKRQHDEQLAAIRYKQEQARAEQEAQRARLELERAAAEAEAMQRRRIQEAEDAQRQRQAQREAETLARAERVQAWRRANGGCDPPMRQQCMTVGSSGGGPRQVLGCTCVR